MKTGLIGQKLSHSLSPLIHSYFGEYNYSLFELEKQDLDSFFKNLSLNALNVTIPYKKDVLKYCDEIDEKARQIGSINTIIRTASGGLKGYNTDYFGFEYLVKRSGVILREKKVLILGTGGAALTVRAVASDMGAREILFISRKGKLNYKNITRHSDAEVIINTTPVGMYPNNGESIIDLSEFNNCEGVIDLIYNPSMTDLLYDAKNMGLIYQNGLPMLVAQGARAAELFTGKKIKDNEIEDAICDIRRTNTNIVLIGMPGCGKSTTARALSALTGRAWIDTDTEIEKSTGMSVPEIFRSMGEKGFREIESEQIIKAGKEFPKIIATGGGAVLFEENRRALKQNGMIVFLDREIGQLSTFARPLSKDKASLEKIYTERLPIYESFSDIRVSVEGTARDVAEKILAMAEKF